MNKYHIRFNTQHNNTGLVWRIFENNQEHLVSHLQISVPVSDIVTNEHGVTKWNIYCEGTMTIKDKVAYII
jgi:hypothetical protein